MKNIYITWHNEWTQLGKKFNWYTATLINLEFENDWHCGNWEFRFVLLGLGFTLVYDYGFDESVVGQRLKSAEETNEELDKKIEEILK